MADHYETLGVPKDAAAEAIKNAYKKKAKKHHPDRAGGDSATMSAINAAYSVLGDPQKRLNYDKTGTDKVVEVDVKARNMIVGLIVSILDNNEADLPAVDIAAANVEQQITAAETNVREGLRVLKRVEKAMKRIKYKGSGANLVLLALQQRAEDIKQKRVQAELNVTVLKRALEMLSDYEYDWVPGSDIDPAFATATAIEEQMRAAWARLRR